MPRFGSKVGETEETSRVERPYTYCMFGFPVHSDVRLPIPQRADLRCVPPAWVFSLAQNGRAAPQPDGPEILCIRDDRGIPFTTIHRGPAGTWIWHSSVGVCHVAPDARNVEIYPEPNADEQVIGIALSSQVSVFILHQLGYPTLHASAVVTENGAIAFVGPKNRGKSTMAACFLKHEATLISDDILPLLTIQNAVYGMPSLPLMKVWPQTVANTLRIEDNLPNMIPEHVDGSVGKKLLAIDGRFDFAEGQARLAALYILSRRPQSATAPIAVTITGLKGRECLIALLKHISFGSCLSPKEMAQFLPVYVRLANSGIVRILSYPAGFECLETIYSRIISDIKGIDNRVVSDAN